MRFGPAEIWRISLTQKTHFSINIGWIYELGKILFVCLPWVRTGQVLTFAWRAVFATLHVHLWESVGSAGVALIPTQIQALSLPLKIFKTGDSLRNEIRGIFPLQSIITQPTPVAAALFIASHWRKSLSRLKWDLGINYRPTDRDSEYVLWIPHSSLLWNFQIYFQCMYFLFWREGQPGQNSSINPRAAENHQFDPRVKGSRLGLGRRREVAKILLAFYSFWSGL